MACYKYNILDPIVILLILPIATCQGQTTENKTVSTVTLNLHFDSITLINLVSPDKKLCSDVRNWIGKSVGCSVSATFQIYIVINYGKLTRNYEMHFKALIGIKKKKFSKIALGKKIGHVYNPIQIDITYDSSANKTCKLSLRSIIIFYQNSIYGGKQSYLDTAVWSDPPITCLPNDTRVHKKAESINKLVNVEYFYFIGPKKCYPQGDACNGYFECNGTERVCRPNYYGEHCKRFCKPQNKTDMAQYDCDAAGYRICKPFWYGKFCSVFCKPEQSITTSYSCYFDGTKMCHKDFSLVNGLCVNACAKTNQCVFGKCRDKFPGDMKCYCFKGYRGDRCDRPICYAGFCRNGGTCEIVNNLRRICHCPPDFKDRRCSNLEPCSWRRYIKHCQNFGECIIKGGFVRCVCLAGYQGEHCEIPPIFGKTETDSLSTWNIKDTDFQMLLGTIIFSFFYTICVIAYCSPRLMKNF